MVASAQVAVLDCFVAYAFRNDVGASLGVFVTMLGAR
jgi:hypothetical protein